MGFKEIQDLLNSNTGVLNLTLFFATLFIGWITGFFKQLIKRPKFKIRVIQKMSFGSEFTTGEKHQPEGQGIYDVNKLAFAIYLEITNVGSKPSSLGKIEVGYLKREIKEWHHRFYRKRVYVKESNVLDPFRINAGEQAILIPFLRQHDTILNLENSCFIDVGKSILGVAYFEQPPTWGNHVPDLDDNNKTLVKIKLNDAFENTYSTKFNLPMITLLEAKRFNPSFGLTEIVINESAKKDPNKQKDKNEEFKTY